MTSYYIQTTDITDWPSSYAAADKTAAIAIAEEAVEYFTKTVFHSVAFDAYYNGNGKKQIFLQLNAPILTITALEIGIEDPTEIDSDYYTFDNQSIWLLYNSEYTIFPEAIRNIHITGTKGVATVPDVVKEACKQLVRSKWAAMELGLTRSTMNYEKLENYSYANKSNGIPRSRTTGFTEIDTMLLQQVRKVPILSIA